MTREESSEAGLSIGAVSKATGISPDTLRTWERRYGFPMPDRTDGGHRVYQMETIELLRLVKRALDRDHRPGQVLGQSREQLQELLGISTITPGQGAEVSTLPEQIHDPKEQVDVWLDAAREFDAERMRSTFERAWFTLGALNFLDDYVGRLLNEVGEQWSKGTMTIAQEHFLSERLRDFLTSQWRSMSDRAKGPMVLCAGLPGEQHNLGLHLVATVASLCGCQIVFLGPNTPLEEIGQTAHSLVGLDTVLVSVSKASNPILVRRDILELKKSLGAKLDLVVGGAGAPGNVAGIKVMTSLVEFSQWLPQKFRASPRN